MIRCPKCDNQLIENGKSLECTKCRTRILLLHCPKCKRLLPVRIEEKIESMRCTKCKETLEIYPEKHYWKIIGE